MMAEGMWKSLVQVRINMWLLEEGPSKICFYKQYIRTHYVQFEFENDILDRGCDSFFSSTCQDDQNEISN